MLGSLLLLMRRRRANDLMLRERAIKLGGSRVSSRGGSRGGFSTNGAGDTLVQPLLGGAHATSSSGGGSSGSGGSSGGSGGSGGGGSGGGGGSSAGAKLPWSAPAGATAFGAKDLSRYTNKYASILGAGSFGVVYGGALPDGRRVAVKQLTLAPERKKKKNKNKKKAMMGSMGATVKFWGRTDPYAGVKGFQLELEVLSKYVHPHLVELIGYCVDKQRGVTVCSLVLEFMPTGSLLGRLRPSHPAAALTAQQRVGIAADVARGLHYLHAEAPAPLPPLIHQDFKSDNILLAEVGGRLIAKVADFGTARMAPQLDTSTVARLAGSDKTVTLKSHVSTERIVGTRPYMPYEYLQSGRVSAKTDTFAYGVVLLELLTGEPPYNEHTGETLHARSYDLMCDPAARLPPMLDARVATTTWRCRVVVDDGAATAAGAPGGRALELCLVAKKCLEHERARCTMREAMPAVVALL